MIKASIVGLIVFLAATLALEAHHGQAAFDQTKKVTLTGTVSDFHFVNPHAVVEFEVKDTAGKVDTWQAEMTSPSHLKGWTATSLEPGDTVTVTGYQARSGALALWITALSSSSGMTINGS